MSSQVDLVSPFTRIDEAEDITDDNEIVEEMLSSEESIDIEGVLY